MKKPTRDSRPPVRKANAGLAGGAKSIPTTAAGEPLDRAAIALLIDAVKPIALPEERNAALRARVLGRVRDKDHRVPEKQFVTVQGTEGGWQPAFPGVDMKLLHDHGDAQSFLLRLAPGASIPMHGHLKDELCVVIEGTVRLNDLHAEAGTFHLARAGSRHDIVSSEEGCVLFLRADLRHGLQY
ncbi:MAG: cupin domain-containing protein [Burkholderiales bacterium]